MRTRYTETCPATGADGDRSDELHPRPERLHHGQSKFWRRTGPVANAAVNFTIIKSSGATVTATATTGSDGTAVYKLRLRKQDPVGIYQAEAGATKGGQSTSAATTFMVK